MQRIFHPVYTHHQSTTEDLRFPSTSTTAELTDRVSFGYRALIAFTMRNHRKIPKKLSGKDLLAKPSFEVDRGVLREFAELASNLGFASPEIVRMQQCPIPAEAVTTAVSGQSRPSLIVEGCGVPKAQRSGIPLTQSYNNDRQCLSLSLLHSDTEEVGDGIASLFVRKHTYQMFFGGWQPSSTLAALQERFERERQAVPQDETNFEQSQVAAQTRQEIEQAQRDALQARKEMEQAQQMAIQAQRQAEQVQ